MIRRWFVGFVVFVGYLCLGAFVFYRIERKEEEKRHYLEILERLELKGETPIPPPYFHSQPGDDYTGFLVYRVQIFKYNFRIIVSMMYVSTYVFDRNVPVSDCGRSVFRPVKKKITCSIYQSRVATL